ncbi:hypothetical protein P4S72_17210 [Vibrio sp. PP-XX7]
MSSYDIALVVDAGTMNTAMSQLYANSEAQKKIFQGTQDVGKGGIKSVDWTIDAAPTFILSPPTQAQLDNKNTFSPNGKKPTQPNDQMFQVEISSMTTTFNMDAGKPISLSIGVIVFAQMSIEQNKIVLSNVAVLPANGGSVDQIYTEILAGIAFNQINTILAGYEIPSSIDIQDQSFTPPVSTISNGYLIVAANLEANGTPDISDVTWPEQPFGMLMSRSLMTGMVDQYKNEIIQELDNKKIDCSDSNWTGSYSLSGGIESADISVGSTLPNIDLTVGFSATAKVGVSWWLVPGACALGAASNLL